MERRYTIHSQAWWASANPMPTGVVESVNFGFYEDSSCVAEAAVSWHGIGRGAPAPRLEAFDDAWAMLAALADEGFFDSLGHLDDTCPGPAAVCDVLAGFGFADATARTNPHDGTAES